MVRLIALVLALTTGAASASARTGRGAPNPPGVSAEEDAFRMWNDPEITCQEGQNRFKVCTNEADPNHLGTMFACPVTCALARGEEVEPALKPITNLDCATAAHQKQETAHPGWRSYEERMGGDVLAESATRQPLGAGWEPILEEQPGCTGLAADELMEYSWLVVLDASWVAYYAEQKEHFAAQGYHTLETSVNLMFDHVSYIFEAQFGVRLRVGRVFIFPDLEEACMTNNNNADDGTPWTSTSLALERAGAVLIADEAGVMRLGAGSRTPGVYCSSSSPIHALCSGTGYHGLNNQVQPFGRAEDGDGGKLNFRAMSTMAHELGHFFGLCGGGVLTSAQCLGGHIVNEVPDMMMAGCVDGQCGSVYGELPRQFRKFLPSCTPLYERLLCRNVQRQTCGVAVKVGSTPAPAAHTLVPTKPTTVPPSTTPEPAADAPLEGYQQQQHLSDKFCAEAPASNEVGQFPVYEYASRQACADACSEAASCTFFLWKGCASGECVMRYHCARWHTASACDAAHDYGDGDSAVIFKKVDSAATEGAVTTTMAGTPATTAAVYTGCFKNEGGDRVGGYIDYLTVPECAAAAFSRGVTHFGMEYPQGSPEGGHAECVLLEGAALSMEQAADSDCQQEVDDQGHRLGNGLRLAVYMYTAGSTKGLTPGPGSGATPGATPGSTPATAESTLRPMTGMTPTTTGVVPTSQEVVGTDPGSLGGAWRHLGTGFCRSGYYTGNPSPGATLSSCKSLCESEAGCDAISIVPGGVCSRYKLSRHVGGCTPLVNNLYHETYFLDKDAAATEESPVHPTTPSEKGTKRPTTAPTNAPTEQPTPTPTIQPSKRPTPTPTKRPSDATTERPTNAPTRQPSERPTNAPTERPTDAPTALQNLCSDVMDQAASLESQNADLKQQLEQMETELVTARMCAARAAQKGRRSV